MVVHVSVPIRCCQSAGLIFFFLMILLSSTCIPQVSGGGGGGGAGIRLTRGYGVPDERGSDASDDDDNDDDYFGFFREEGERGGGGGERERGWGRRDLSAVDPKLVHHPSRSRKAFEWVSHPAPRLPRRRHVFRLSDFGGVGDGRTLNTEAFEEAIAKIRGVAEDGGAELHVEAGDWLTGPFNLTSRMTLHVEKGATILGSKDPSHYPLVAPWPSFGSGRNAPGPRYLGLINGHYLTDIVLTGEGTIDGQGDWVWKLVGEEKFNYTPGCMIEFMWSKRIIISGLTLTNSTFWNIHPIYCNRVYIHGLHITAPEESHNTDGIDINSCRRVIIEDCNISTGDDAISIKSGWDQYGIRYGMPSEKIKIRSLIVGTSHGISIGSELSGGVRKVEVDGVRFLGGSDRGFRIKTTVGRGGLIRDITVKNMELKGILRAAVEFNMNYSSNGFTHPDDKYDRTALTTIRDIIIRRAVGFNCSMIGQFKGIPDSPIKRIHLEEFFFENTTKPEPYLCSNTTGTQHKVVPPAPLNCFHLVPGRRGRSK